jgi:hypothetical protein
MNLLGFPASDDEIDRFLALEADPKPLAMARFRDVANRPEQMRHRWA